MDTGRTEKAQKTEEAERPEKSGQPEEAERPEKSGQPEKTEQTEEGLRQEETGAYGQAEARYRLWMQRLSDSDPLKRELEDIACNLEEIRERFSREMTFGTAGLRGKMRAGTNGMNNYTVFRASRGIAAYIAAQGKEAMERGILIAHDPRHHSREFSEMAAAVFAKKGIRVYMFDGMRPTPELACLIRKLHTISGVNITASHNPKEYNGYKVYWEDGCQVSGEVAAGMEQEIRKFDYFPPLFCRPEKNGNGTGTEETARCALTDAGIEEIWFSLVGSGMIHILDASYDSLYLDMVASLAIHSGSDIDLSIPFVYTPLNGAGSKFFRRIMRRRGFTGGVIVPEQENPDPDFSTVGYPNPEDPKAFALAEKLGRKTGAELLLATDPDSDRFAAEVRGEDGNYIPLNGNQTGYLLVNYILEGRKSAGTLPEKGAMVRSIVTGSLSSDIAASYGVKMFESLTGFKNICGRIDEITAKGYTYLFGYEESVGYAAHPEIRDKDGISAGMLLTEAAAYYRKQGKTLWQELQEIYRKYGYVSEIETSIVLEGEAGRARIGRMMEAARTRSHLLTDGVDFAGRQLSGPDEGFRTVRVIDYLHGYAGTDPDGADSIPPQNAIRIFLKNGAWFAIRPSGTEPKIKFYFYAKGASSEEAASVNRRISEEVLSVLREVR